MAAKRQNSRSSASSRLNVNPPRSSSSSSGVFLFWGLILSLCAGGYWYYDYAQERNQEQRDAQEQRAQERLRQREENKLKSQQLRDAAKQRAHAKQQERARKWEEQQRAVSEKAHDDAAAEAELAAREAKEREAILAAEELQRLREMEERDDMLNPYRHEGPLPEEDASEPVKSAVASALEQYNVFNAKPKENADFYIYLCSAGWCGNCVSEMKSAVVREYKEIRKTPKVELILISFDRSLEDARAFTQKCKIKCPTIWIEEMRQKAFQQLPGFADDGCGVPHIFIVDKDGKVIVRGHGSNIKNWRHFTVDFEKKFAG